MEIPERWRERIVAAAQENCRDHDWARFQVECVRHSNGQKLVTEITAPNKIHAAAQVGVVGEVLSVIPI